jgi:hypothetical protein
MTGIELELELIQTHMTQKPMLRALWWVFSGGVFLPAIITGIVVGFLG